MYFAVHFTAKKIRVLKIIY